MNSQFTLRRSAWLVSVVDLAVILFSYFFAYAIRFAGDIPGRHLDSFLNYAPWIGVMGILTFYLFNLYNFSGRVESARYYYNLVLSHVMVAAEWIVINYWDKSFVLPRSVVLLALLLQFGLIFLCRIALFQLNANGAVKRALIIVQNSANDAHFVEKVLQKGRKWFEVKSVVLGDDASLLFELSAPDIDLFILSPDINPGIKERILQFAGKNRKEVMLIPEFYELFLMGAESQQIDDLLVYSIMPPNLSHIEKVIKRTTDLSVSFVLLLLTSPVTLLCCMMIPMTSRGRPIYRQERVGLDEKPFMVLKFRSMVNNAENGTGPVLSIDKDSRVTRLGKFLRATRIDELPQLINVLKGEMSLVGPRPERDYFITRFKQEMPHYSYRFMVKPGLTGLAQVMGNYSTMPSDKLRYDLFYIKNYSPLLDIKILFQTIVVVLQREQAKGLTVDPSAAGKVLMLPNAQSETAAAYKEEIGTI